MNRRNFLQAQVGVAGLSMLPFETLARSGTIKNVLFQGDSITDAGRNQERTIANDPWSLGSGYAYQTVAKFLARNPGTPVEFFNKGISGNKVFQLAERWEKDCLELKPDVLSIMIGVNDFWHTLHEKDPYQGTVDVYDRDLRALLDRTRNQFPNVEFIIAEPFAVIGGSAIGPEWTNFVPYQEACKAIANDYDAVFIPLQKYFDNALRKASVSFWCPDGVHPSIPGCALMAKHFLKALRKVGV